MSPDAGGGVGAGAQLVDRWKTGRVTGMTQSVGRCEPA